MKRIVSMIIAIMLLLGAMPIHAQSNIYRKMKQKARDMGYTHEKKEVIDLNQGEYGYCFFTAKPGRTYKVFGFPEFSNVTDTDIWVYDDDNNAKLLGKDVGDHPVGIVDFSVTRETRISVKIKNIETIDEDFYSCCIMVTYKKVR